MKPNTQKWEFTSGKFLFFYFELEDKQNCFKLQTQGRERKTHFYQEYSKRGTDYYVMYKYITPNQMLYQRETWKMVQIKRKEKSIK